MVDNLFLMAEKPRKVGRPASEKDQTTVRINREDGPLFSRLARPFSHREFLERLCAWLDEQDDDALMDIKRGKGDRWRITPTTGSENHRIAESGHANVQDAAQSQSRQEPARGGSRSKK